MTTDEQPDEYPSDYRNLSHEDLDDFGIVRGTEKRPLTLEQRQNSYRLKYLLSDDERRKANRRDWVLFGLFLAVVAAVGIPVGLSLGNDGPDKDAAYAACQQGVERQLKSPSSASFPPQSSATSTTSDDDTFTFSSYVDAENSLGAAMRVSWKCTAVWEREDAYTVDVVVTE